MTNTSPAEQASIETLQQLRQAIDNQNCFRLEAGAGAGKTYSLVRVIKYLLEDEKCKIQLRQDQKVACITYTNVATKEILDRLDNNPTVFSDTIHGFSWSLLKDFQMIMRELIPSLSSKWSDRVKEVGGISNQIVKYDLGFPSIDDKYVSLHHDDVVSLMSQMLGYPKFRALLKNRFPVIFIDEYQDTNIHLAESIVENLIENESGIIIGLFGDHWQKIYGTSACGLIASEKGKIVEIGKGANFRSDKNIVQCLNRVRPELPQAIADPTSLGEVQVYHSNAWSGERRTGGHWKGDLPADDANNYLEKTKSILESDGWDMSPQNTKILVLTNNLIAQEQSFKELADNFSYTDDYLKKNNKYIKYFLEVVEPIIAAYENQDYGEIFQTGNRRLASLTRQSDKRAWSESLADLVKARQGSIGDVLDYLFDSETPRLSVKVHLSEVRYRSLVSLDAENITDEDKVFLKKMNALRKVDYKEVCNLGFYINDQTPFSTKHGVKGAQYDNVLVVFGRGWNQYNWNQLLEWFDGSCPTDKQQTFERNRNLFYVACSRAKHNLTILFTQELTEGALSQAERIFLLDNIKGDPFV